MEKYIVFVKSSGQIELVMSFFKFLFHQKSVNNRGLVKYADAQ